jgi:hypothetical protein
MQQLIDMAAPVLDALGLNATQVLQQALGTTNIPSFDLNVIDFVTQVIQSIPLQQEFLGA